MTTKKKTKVVQVGKVKVGGENPVAVQSMCSTDTRDVATTVTQIHEMEKAGCEIVRVAVPDMAAALALGEIKKQITIPLVADIHFDFRLAIEAAKQGVDKLRINPGNIGGKEKIKQVVDIAKEKIFQLEWESIRARWKKISWTNTDILPRKLWWSRL